MFSKACSQVRESIYGVLGSSNINAKRVNITNATAFMIAPGILSTAAHFVHVENDPSKPVHTSFEAIRMPDIGQQMETAQLVAEDSAKDIALLRIDNPRSNTCVPLEAKRVPIGTSCGSSGFPLAQVVIAKAGKMFNLVERFQGASISAFITQADRSGQQLSYYETDALMYRGSSGCPGFLTNGTVFGMHNRSRVEKPKGTSSSSIQMGQAETRLAISIWVSSMDIIDFAKAHGIIV
ncbi:MAG: trypsin-like peptidase domain-containing protein [Dehalococcoidales bacterium]|nr:MAG: trypsin-like peptidase domain-containing protein [Dehalococcoidales bacterium]